MLRVLIAVDGSASSLRAVKYVVAEAVLSKKPPELHVLNVQRAFPGTVRGVHSEAVRFHREQGMKVLGKACKRLEAAGLKYVCHVGVGDSGEVIARFVRDKKIRKVVMGTRGLGRVANMLLGSVANKVLHMVDVPVLLVK